MDGKISPHESSLLALAAQRPHDVEKYLIEFKPRPFIGNVMMFMAGKLKDPHEDVKNLGVYLLQWAKDRHERQVEDDNKHCSKCGAPSNWRYP